MAEFTFEIEEHLLTLSEMKKDGPKKSIVSALMVRQRSLTFVAGVLTTPRWGKELPSQMKNFKSWWMLIRINKHSSKMN